MRSADYDQTRAAVRFTVATVSFNAAATIETTIRSVIAQNHDSFEYIIIDGASSDNTVAIINSYLKNVDCLISEKDNGIYDAMNKAVANAKGEYIVFLNADDYFYFADILELIDERIKETNADAVMANIVQVDAKGAPRRFMHVGWYRKSMLRLGLMPPHPGFFVRTSKIVEAGGFSTKYRIAGDFDIIRRLFALRDFRAAKCPQLATVMRIGGVSTGGLNASRLVTREISQSLGGHSIYLYFRYLWKLAEILHGTALRIAGKNYKPKL